MPVGCELLDGLEVGVPEGSFWGGTVLKHRLRRGAMSNIVLTPLIIDKGVIGST
jgi:hypothetical protein